MSQAQQQMFNFCPHCGKGIHQQQVPGQKLFCRYCGKDIGTPSVVTAAVSAGTIHTVRPPTGPDPTEALIQKGTAARCRFCNQVVEVRGSGANKTFVPHYGPGPGRKICKSSGRRIED